MPWGKGPDEFMRFLVEKGLVNPPAVNQTAPPSYPNPQAQFPTYTPPPPPPMPQYENSSRYRVRGIEGQQNRAYVPPYQPPYVPPHIPFDMAPDLWAELTPEEQAEQLAMEQSINAGVLPPAQSPESVVQLQETQAELAATADPIIDVNTVIGDVSKAFGDAVVDPVFDRYREEGPEGLLSGIGEGAVPAAGTVLDLYEKPLEERKSITGDVIYQQAIGTPGNEGAALPFDLNMPQVERAYEAVTSITFDDLAAMNPDLWGAPAGFYLADPFQTDEQKAAVKKIYEDAEAAGNDGGAAVWEWYIGYFSALKRFGTEVAGDPTNWPLMTTGAGQLLLATKVAKGATTGGKVARVIGNVLKGPELIVDAPFEVPAAAYRAIGWSSRKAAAKAAEETAQQTGNIITRSSSGQIARDVERQAIEQTHTAERLAETYGSQAEMDALNAREFQQGAARIQAEQNIAATGVVPAQPRPELLNVPRPGAPLAAFTPSARGPVVQPGVVIPPTTGVPPTESLTPVPSPGVLPTGIVPSIGQPVQPGLVPTPLVDANLPAPPPGVAYMNTDVLIDRMDPEVVTFIRAYESDEVNKFSQAFANQGFDPNQPITLKITRDGQAGVAEGNHRLIAANDSGLARVPVRTIRSTTSDPWFKPVPGLAEDIERDISGRGVLWGSDSDINAAPSLVAPGVPPTGIVPSTGLSVQPGLNIPPPVEAIPTTTPMGVPPTGIDPSTGPPVQPGLLTPEDAIVARANALQTGVPPVTRIAPDISVPSAITPHITGAMPNSGYTLNPDPTGYRAVDVLARDQPHIYEVVAPDIKPWVDDTFEPSNQLLRTDVLSPENELLKVNTIPYAEPYQAKGTAGFSLYRGTNKASSQILNGELLGRMKISTYANGGDIADLKWSIPDPLVFPIPDEELAKRLDLMLDETREEFSKEAFMAKYIFGDGKFDEFLEKGLVKAKVFRKTSGVTPKEQRAFARYVEAKRWQEVARADTPEKMDTILAKYGIEKRAPQINPADTAKLPTPDQVRARGDSYSASNLSAITSMPANVQAEVTSELGAWATEAYRGIDLATPRTKAFADLELGARTRALAAERGVPLTSPGSIPYNAENIDEMIRAAVQEPDEMASSAIIKQLEDAGQSQRTPPDPYWQAGNPGLYASQKLAYENYLKMQDLRQMLHSSVEDLQAAMVQRNALNARPLQGPSIPRGAGPPRTTTVSQAKYEEQIEKEVKRILRAWSLDPTKGVPTKGDFIIAAGVADGAVSEADAIALRTLITINTGTRKVPVTHETTVMDLFIDESLKAKNKPGADAVRSTNDIIRQSMRLSGEATTKTNRYLMKSGKVYDSITNVYRQNYMYLPTSVIRGGVADLIGSSYTQFIEGHRISALKALLPSTHWAMIKHNWTGEVAKSPILNMADAWGTRPGANVIDVVTREFQEVGKDVAWSAIPGLGKPYAKVIEGGMAVRHSFDQSNRLNLWGDEFGRQINVFLNGQNESVLRNTMGVESFYDRVIGQMGGGKAADDAVANLRTMADGKGFLPSDVKRITGRADLQHEWREIVDQAKKNADAEVNRVFFSYRQTQADAVTRRVFMFHYWMSRALVQHTRLTISNPLLLYRYTQTWEALDREAKRQGLDGPMAPLQMYFEFMRGDGGMFGISNPIAYLTPYSMFADVFNANYGNETEFDKRIRQMGGFLLPQIQGAAVAFGLTSRYPDLLGTSTLRSTVRKLLDWDRNSGYDIFQQGPGITGDPLQHWMNRTLERINAMANVVYPELNDVEVPNLNEPKQNAVANVIVEQAELDFGVPYIEMTPDQQKEVQAAIWAVRHGEDDNDRANEALATVSTGEGWASIINMVLPGGMRARSENRTDNALAIDTALDTGIETPASDNAFAVNEAINSGSPEASELTIENEELRGIGTERQNDLYKGWNIIVYDQIDGSQEALIGGKVYSGYEINRMTHEQRVKLADAWVLDNMGTKELESYREDRDEVIAASPDLTEYKAYSKAASKYEGEAKYTYDSSSAEGTWVSGGVRAMRLDFERLSPQFGQQVDAERKRLEAQGKTGEELENSLDIWAAGTEGYNAWRGIKDDIRDKDVIDTMDPGKQLPPLTTVESGTSASSSTTTSDTPKEDTGGYGGNWDAENNRPLYQTELVNEWKVYETAIATFEKEHGPIEDYSYADEFVGRSLPDPTSTLSRYLKWRFEQMEAGKPGDIDSYLKKLDADYKAKHPEKDAA